ncbi:MAG: hypothetical protein ACLFSO_09095 [Halanaerobium sp.]
MKLSRKLFVMLLAVVMVLGITSMVGAFPSGDYYSDWYINSTADGYWNGNDILAEVEQLHGTTDSDAEINQFNTGSSNYAGIGQHGTDLDAVINQEGNANFVRVSQGWNREGNDALVDQTGNLNRVRTQQGGEYDELYVKQDGYFNYARVDQFGTMNSYAEVKQFGDQNGAAIFQDDYDDMTATVFQDGMDNEAVINQTGGAGGGY